MRALVSRMGFIAVVIGFIVVIGQAPSQAQKRPQAADVQSREIELRLSVFSGNELRLGAYWLVNGDCTSQLVDVRVARKPSKGEIAFKESRTVVEVARNSQRARCNGQPIDAVTAYYTSREDFTGQDRMAVDVDYKAGIIRRYNYIVRVR